MKKNILSVFIIIFVLGFDLIFIVLPKKDFSENENRYLAKFPKFSFETLLSGEYISDLESYLADHFPLRDTFMTIKTNYQLLIGQKLINDTYIGKDEYLFQNLLIQIN